MSHSKFVAKTFSNLEPVLAGELEELGASSVEPGRRAVSFRGDKRLLYKANLYVRTALRILQPIADFLAQNEREFYRQVQKIDWHRWLSPEGTLAVDASVTSSFLTHSGYLALKTKDAIVDQFRDRFGRRPSVDVRQPQLRLNVYAFRNRFTLSLDSSGESLHRRGYRLKSNDAPLNEVLAAGMVLLSGWQGEENFVDPLCGSGTLAIEAALKKVGLPPGLHRRFGFMNWPNFDARLWNQILSEVPSLRKRSKGIILASDISEEAVALAEENAHRAGVAEEIEFRVAPFDQISPPNGGGILITNPPYDQRLKIRNVREFYKNLGDFFKQNCAGYTVWLLTGNREALKFVGLHPSQKITLYNGGLESKFVKFDMYKGSRKRPPKSGQKKAE